MIEPKNTESSYRLLVQCITDYAIYMLSPEGVVSNWNAGAQRFKGYEAGEIVGKNFATFYTPEDRRTGLPQRALARARQHGRFEGEGWRVRKDGSRFWAHVIIDQVLDESGNFLGFAKITRDKTEAKQQEDRLRAMRERLDLALQHMSQGLCLFDAEEQLLLCNPQFEAMLGAEPGSISPGVRFTEVLRRLHAREGLSEAALRRIVTLERKKHLDALASEGEMMALEQRWGQRVVQVSHCRLPEGGWVSTMEDVTDRKRIESQIAKLAHYDSLTELPNRAAFRAEVENTLRSGTACTLLYLDLDRFKPVNDTLGHLFGDKVLRIVAERITSQLRSGDIAGRLGGDEFGVLLVNCSAQGDAIGVASRLNHAISQPIRVDNVEIGVGVSVGIAFADTSAMEAEILLRNADLALYAVKRDQRGGYRLYAAEMQSSLQLRRDLERDLRQALIRKEFALHYQPVVNVDQHTVSGFEALLRWESPTRGKVAPGDFIPFAEEQGLMPEIGEWVLRAACSEAAGWDRDLTISVNLSPTQFRSPDLVGKVAEVLRETGLAPERLELEITETAMIGDVSTARVILEQLRAYGVRIAMDDFGTGYSSLSFLRSLPFTRIKIDRSFVQDLGKTQESLAIVRAVTGLCSSLGVATTAEGVETEQQMQILRAEGCMELQGYLLGRPQPLAEHPTRCREILAGCHA